MRLYAPNDYGRRRRPTFDLIAPLRTTLQQLGVWPNGVPPMTGSQAAPRPAPRRRAT